MAPAWVAAKRYGTNASPATTKVTIPFSRFRKTVYGNRIFLSRPLYAIYL